MNALSEAIEDAQFLLAFCARRGISIDPAARSGIIEAAAELAQTQDVSSARREAFWDALTAISKAVHPATIDGIIAQFPNRTFANAAGEGMADQRVRTYRNQAMAALVLLFIVQVYWVIGSSLAQDVEKLNAEVAKLTASLRDREAAVKAAGGTPATDRAIQEVTAAKDGAANKLAARHGLLQKWNTFNPLSRIFRVDVPAPRRVSVELQATQFALLILQSYLLPLLYGWLGACVYILRTVGADIAGLSYAQYRHALYRMREALGALAGFALAWLTGPKTEGAFASLPPLALAFVAGYSVDMLFTFLDRIVAAFTKPTS